MTTGNRVKDTTTTVGTGDITLAGAPAATYQGLSGIPGGVGTTFGYFVGGAAEWEIGTGTKTGTNTFSRVPEASSNANALVNFSAGTKDFFAALTAIEINAFVSLTGTQTLTNKRVKPRIVPYTYVNSSTAPVYNTDLIDRFKVNAISGTISSMTSGMTGTPDDGDLLIIDMTATVASATINWGTGFEGSSQALPAATSATIGQMQSMYFERNGATSKWRFVSIA